MTGGYGAMLSFQVQGCKDKTIRTQIITRATSLGSTHTLIEHRAWVEGPTSKTPQNLLRLSVGLEHVDDLISDLEECLSILRETMKNPPHPGGFVLRNCLEPLGLTIG